MNALILYATTNGQTEKIAKRLSDILVKQAISVDLVRCEDTPYDLSRYQLVVMGSRIRYGKHHKAMTHFIEQHKAELKQKETAFFSVNLVARKPEKAAVETNPYVKKYLKQVDLNAAATAVFPGKLQYPAYRWIDKKMIQLIMKMTGGPTDTTQTYEYTDWQQVDAFAEALIILVSTIDTCGGGRVDAHSAACE